MQGFLAAPMHSVAVLRYRASGGIMCTLCTARELSGETGDMSRIRARRDLTTWCPTGWSFTWHFVLKRACEPFIGCIFLGQKARAGIKPATACFPIERRANTSPITARRSQPFFGQVWTHFGKQQYFLPLTTLNNSTIDTRGSKVS